MSEVSNRPKKRIVGFSSLPYVEKRSDDCGETYTEYDGREGSFQARCTLKKNHWGRHGQRGF